MKNLEKYGVQEMSSKEVRNTDGGIAPIIWVIIVVGGLLLSGDTTDKS